MTPTRSNLFKNDVSPSGTNVEDRPTIDVDTPEIVRIRGLLDFPTELKEALTTMNETVKGAQETLRKKISTLTILLRNVAKFTIVELNDEPDDDNSE